ncbi:hypothetical protein ACO22_07183 [Paracoccidioides brasiliensis]|uniref:Uncharacterized protein n=1 Tax=Paracoccidioides brasiliensis TaxID=121759 RepID=A0A1D2J5D4_PARBR|nr:hypothetical protein ACO22_07183 [Paracoccidioides brasiliensis]
MSSTSLPITPQAFAEALKSLPLSFLYAKGSELRNSIAHLQRSNDELARYMAEEAPDGRDKDCEDAIRENEEVVVHMRERIELLKVEVEGRGQMWSEELEMEVGIASGADVEPVGMEAGNEVDGHSEARMTAEAPSTGSRRSTAGNSTEQNNDVEGQDMTIATQTPSRGPNLMRPCSPPS